MRGSARVEGWKNPEWFGSLCGINRQTMTDVECRAVDLLYYYYYIITYTRA